MALLVLLDKVVLEQRHVCCPAVCQAHRALTFTPSAGQGQGPGSVQAPEEEMVRARGGPSLLTAVPSS